MKKTVAALMFPLLASCAPYCNKPSCQAKAEPAPMPVVYQAPVQEINPCACVNTPEPCREVLHPRVVQEVPEVELKRPCDDHQFLNCGCGQCDTFHPYHEQTPDFYMQTPKIKTIVPAQPKAYQMASSRAFNRFIKDTYGIYSKKPGVKLYVENPISKESDLPAGIDDGVRAFKAQVGSSRTFTLTNVPSEADYTLKTSAEWFDTESKDVPAIKYITKLVDNHGKTVNTWTEIVKRADNKSWL
ncbi:MAG: hypothetical protein IJ870_05555 [Alphaproteobacteria bacterium]|nr:hypothetical protein [Alphaproteobacteria bacterium]